MNELQPQPHALSPPNDRRTELPSIPMNYANGNTEPVIKILIFLDGRVQDDEHLERIINECYCIWVFAFLLLTQFVAYWVR